ncbi:uncharacterized protein LOC135478070 [Liolophura sinensis]|uniref:uncharacterized protein LOC135478070 n=1 Tax=Liolophura sinensis TaxID=3198878 RepID=UPI003158F4F1
MVLCAAPGPCDQPYKLSTTMWQGKECPGCSYCPSKTDKTREVIEVKPMCPMAKCRAPGPCDRPYSMSYIEIGGMKCPMCPFCERNQLKPQREVLNPGLIHLEICPIPMCVAPGPCDHPYSMSYVTVGDKKCPMCAYCKKDTKREVITSPRTCPLLPCLPLIDCAQTQSTTYQFEGRSCPGCPVCTQPKQ